MVVRRIVVRRIHLTFAVIAGLLLSVVSVSGALVIFRTEMDWLHADVAEISHHRQVDIDATARTVIEHYPTARIQRLLTPTFTGAGDEWVLRDDHGNSDATDDEVWKVFTDPATGSIIGDTHKSSFSYVISWIARFHHNLWLGSTGGILVGSAGLCLLGFIVTGLWLWWPGLKRFSRGFRLRLGKPGFMRYYDLHNWSGLIGIPLFLVLGLTGAMFEFRWMRAAVHYGLGGSEADRPLSLRMPSPPPIKKINKSDAQAMTTPAVPGAIREIHSAPTQVASVTLSQAIKISEATVPGSMALSIVPPRLGRADATWSVLLDYPWNVGSYSGALVQIAHDGSAKLMLDPRHMSAGGWVNAQLWGLHTGTWGGAWSKALYLIVGLLPPLLLITGCLLFLNRYRQSCKTSAARQVAEKTSR